MSNTPTIAISQALTPRLALMIEVQVGGDFLELYGKGFSDGPATAEDLSIISVFLEGLKQHRFELHGPVVSAPAETVLAHLETSLQLPDMVEVLCDDVVKHGTPDQVTRWEALDGLPFDDALIQEAKALGEILRGEWKRVCSVTQIHAQSASSVH